MLKYWLVLLLVLNATALAWQWDVFARWGHGPNHDREPARLQQQVRPDALKLELMPPASATVNAPTLPEASGEATALPRVTDAGVPDAAPQAPALSAPATVAPRVSPQ